MALEARRRLHEGICGICALDVGGVPRAIGGVQSDDAWARLKRGIVAVRKDTEALEEFSSDQVCCVIHFLVDKATTGKFFQAQVRECLKIVLGSSSWLAGAREHFADPLQQLFAGDSDMQAKLSKAPASCNGQEGFGAVALPLDEETTRSQHIRWQLARGVGTMKAFGWQFPCDPLGTKMDEATGGFRDLHGGATALTTASGLTALGGDAASALAEWELDFRGILQFLESMRTSGVRSAYASQIKFVVSTFGAISPEFHQLAQEMSFASGESSEQRHQNHEDNALTEKVGSLTGGEVAADDLSGPGLGRQAHAELALTQTTDSDGRDEETDAESRGDEWEEMNRLSTHQAEVDEARRQAEEARAAREWEDYCLACELQISENEAHQAMAQKLAAKGSLADSKAARGGPAQPRRRRGLLGGLRLLGRIPRSSGAEAQSSGFQASDFLHHCR